jgi:hypothetical protein
MPFREVSNKITTSKCPKCLFHYSHFCLHIIVIFLSKYNNVLDSKSLSVTLSTTRTIENTCTNNWNWKWRIFIWWLYWGQWTLLYLWNSWTSCNNDPITHRICQLGLVPSVWTLGTPEILCSTTSCKKGYNNCTKHKLVIIEVIICVQLTVFNQSFSDRFCVLKNLILNKYYGKDIG